MTATGDPCRVPTVGTVDLIPGEFVRYAIRTPCPNPFGLNIEEHTTSWFFVRYLGRYDRHAVVENANGERFLVDPGLLATADVQLIEPPVISS